MRRWTLLMLAITLCANTGCALKPKRSSSWLPQFRGIRGLDAKDAVQIDVALVETRIGNEFVNNGLWLTLDEQFLSFENKQMLEKNGFRLGTVGASPPAELLALLTSERSCSNPRRLQVRAGNTAPPIVIGKPQEKIELNVHRLAKDPETLTFEQAEVMFSIVPELTEDNRTKLTITPQIRHGEAGRKFWKASSESSRWTMQLNRPKHDFESLSWEVTLSPGQYLVIGGKYDTEKSLGRSTFVRPDETDPVQRLLVIRTSRSQPGVAEEKDEQTSNSTTTRKISPPPLAVQAGSMRGYSR